MAKLNINPGDKYGKLTVIKESEKLTLPSGQTNRVFLCICECGKEKNIRLAHLTNKKSTSCGCVHYTRNNEYKTPIYNSYRAMINRTKENYINRSVYFDKGIGVCEEWLGNFNSFKQWALKNGFDKRLQLDRIENSKGYSPENCRYVPSKKNVNNRDNTFIVTYNGENYPFTEICEKLNINYKTRTIRSRIERGWDHTLAIDTPIKKGNYVTGKRN